MRNAAALWVLSMVLVLAPRFGAATTLVLDAAADSTLYENPTGALARGVRGSM